MSMVVFMGRGEIKDIGREKREENNFPEKKRNNGNQILSKRITFKRWEVTSERKERKREREERERGD